MSGAQRVRTWSKWMLDAVADRSTMGARQQLRLKVATESSGWEQRFHAQLGPGSRAVDVGAHVGSLSTLWADRFDEIWAFEPNWALASRLHRTVGPNTVVVAAACGAEAGPLQLRVPRHHGRPVASLGTLRPGGSGDGQLVPVVRLDDVVPRPVDLLKIDVEGFEVEVLAGAAEILSDRPVVIIECEERHRPGSPAEVHKLLAELGMSGLMVFGHAVLDASEFDPAVHQANPPSAEGEVRSDYVEQFIFVPDEEVSQWRQRLADCVSP